MLIIAPRVQNSSLLLHQHTQFQGSFKMKRFGQHALHQSNNQNDNTSEKVDGVISFKLRYVFAFSVVRYTLYVIRYPLYVTRYTLYVPKKKSLLISKGSC